EKQLDFNFLSKGLSGRFNAIRLPAFSSVFRSKPFSSRNIKGCNLAFWKDDYIKVNGYYNGFEGWGWEDCEFAERLINVGIKKKRLKWAAIGYHLYHPISSKGNFGMNKQIYDESVAQKLSYREPGYLQTASSIIT